MASYSTKLGLVISLVRGELAGTWHDIWSQDNTRTEARLTKAFAGDPNASVEGDFVGQWCWDSTNKRQYFCTTVGDAATAVWETQSLDIYALEPSGTLRLWDKPDADIPSGWTKVGSVDGKYLIFTDDEALLGDIVGSNAAVPTMQSAGSHSHGGSTGGHAITLAELTPHEHVIFGVTGNASGVNTRNVVGATSSSNTVTDTAGGGDPHSHTISTQAAHTHTMDSFDKRPESVYYSLIKKD